MTPGAVQNLLLHPGGSWTGESQRELQGGSEGKENTKFVVFEKKEGRVAAKCHFSFVVLMQYILSRVAAC